MPRWLLQRLEQSVERLGGEHVNFVDDVDLVLRTGRANRCVGAELADLIDPAIAGPVDLDDVHVVTGINGQCDLGPRIEFPGSIIGGIQGLGENASGARFAYPSSASEEISMPDAVGFDRP